MFLLLNLDSIYSFIVCLQKKKNVENGFKVHNGFVLISTFVKQ